MLKVKIFFILIFLTTLASQAQTTGKISGKVLDAQGEPVVGANIIIEGTTMGAAADPEGYFYIINVPSGLYKVKASAIGYTSQITENVQVISGLTTRIDFTLQQSAVQMQEIVVQHTRPPVQKDLTYKMQGINASDLEELPIKGSVKDLITKQAGVTANISTIPISSQPVFGQFATIPSDGLHFRGGRTNETLYLFDGINVTDGLWGGYNLDVIGEYTLQSLSTMTGTFGPQFGEAMSAVMLMNTLDNVVQQYSFKGTAYTDKLGNKSGTQNTWNYEFAASGPIPFLKNLSFIGSARLYSSDGYINGFIYPDYIDTRGIDKSGNPTIVPMQYRDTELYFGKLIWQIFDKVKLRGGYLTSKVTQGIYNHYFKYNPYGTPHVHYDDELIYTKLTHVLSQSTYYDIHIAKYSREFKSHVYDNPLYYEIVPAVGSGEFSISGTDFVFFNSRFDRTEASGTFSSQISNQQFIQIGGTFEQFHTQLTRLNPYGWQYLEDYDFKPFKFSGFVNDKMEFSEIGMVINVGLRYDYFNPNREFVTNIENPLGEIGKVKSRQYLSPRLGISYPISDIAAFRFGYGHYYQYPYIYMANQGMNRQYELYPYPNITSVQGAIAKGDLQEEKTINYEVGVQIKVTDDISADITGFYRKMSNLVGIRIITGYITSGDVVKEQKFPIFDNVNYANVKGVELSIYKRMTEYFQGFLNYTYSQALVTSSLLFSLPQDLSRTFPADWDQTHTLSFGGIFQFPDKWGFSLLGSLQSGLPYTYNQFQPNEERAPMITYLDVLGQKEFSFGPVTAKLFVQIFNILNRKNIWWVYPDSGQPGVDTNPATSDDYTNNPTMWGPGRRVQIGISFNY
ncbi:MULTISPECIES: TonB-dependent receptor [Ignavibacterium]|uniref:TonB-dependent receptor n=1 Tax=Ignavibacterium TaxID=795750 RepID=UPI0025BE4C05|nr:MULTISPECIES: TonB-dependent receptor [Ignavibacterium]MBI5662134.1 TonB-dependent receptor [Ignavibacterium album]